MYPIGYIDCTTTWDEWAKAHPEIVNKKRKVLLRNGQSPGDLIVWTRAIGDLKECYPNYQIGIECPAMEIFENSPRITQLNKEDQNVETFNIAYDEINQGGWSGIHFSDAWRHDMEKKLGVPIKKTGIRPELWISDLEKTWINQVEMTFGWKGSYILLNAGHKQDNLLKQYHKYQEVVDLLNRYFGEKVKIVTIGHKDHIHPRLKGVLNLVGQTDLRQMIRLAYWSQMSIGPISLQFVMSAALGQPAVVIAAGKEGPRWQRYNWIRYITNVGALPCAEFDGCWLGGEKGKCTQLIKYKDQEIPKCFAMITPEEIAKTVEDYYEGGLLKIPTKKENKKFQRDFKDFQKTKKRK